MRIGRYEFFRRAEAADLPAPPKEVGASLALAMTTCCRPTYTLRTMSRWGIMRCSDTRLLSPDM